MNYKTLILASSVTLLTACVANTDSEIEGISLEDHHKMTETFPSKELSRQTKSEIHKQPSKELMNNTEDALVLVKPNRSPEVQSKKIMANSLAALPATPMMSSNTLLSFNQETNNEVYADIEHNSIKLVSTDPVSTFSVDVDTGSYTNIRRILNQGYLPPVNAVRIEELVNYFDYAYEEPTSLKVPFSINTELAKAPWSDDHVLLKIGLKGYEPPTQDRALSNLVFLLDVSGSMNSPDKLPLLKRSLVLLSKQLSEEDKVSIVVYAGASGIALEPTKGSDTVAIENALNNLAAGGGTNGQAGIHQAYQLAKQNFIPEGINRVILATDGDFNVGTSNVEELKKLIETKRKDGISLTTLGFGTGNYNDKLMEQLADVGNGNYSYIDSFKEARKVLVEQLNSTLMTIAKDVKIQIEMNPSVVKEYRLLGYENRSLAREDFNNDKVDAGEIGAGHTVTAIYELVLQSSNYSAVDELRYQTEPNKTTSSNLVNELGFVKFRYKAPNGKVSKLISKSIERPVEITKFTDASTAFRFSASVAQFGEALRHSKYIKTDYETIINNSQASKGGDSLGYRSEFIQLVRLASSLDKG